MAKLTFLGAAGCVTGSKYLVEAAGKRLLVDCGIFQGTQELQERNYKPLPVDPKTIDYQVLTHAHLDHTGWLPVLVKSGYRGPIYANPATMELTITEGGKKTVVVFSGDIGRYNQPILKDPATPPSKADVLICESTYGDREHPEGDAAELLAQIVNRVVKRGGSIVIPSFAIGRTQTFMYYLRQLEDQQRIPRLPVYVDSPMAISATDLYIKHKEDHDLEFTREEGSHGKGDPLNVHEFHLTRSVEESKAINNVKTPCIIISASGMVSGGRVLHHLAQRLPDARNAVILAGFQAEGTRGRALQEGAKLLKLYGQDVPVLAEIVEMGQFSAHAGKSELLRWLAALPAPPKQTYLTHGEPAAAQALQASISEKFQWKAAVARYLDTVPVGE